MSYLQLVTKDSFTVISNPLAKLVTNNGAVLFQVIATKQDYYFKDGKWTVIDGEPYFWYVQPKLAENSNITVRQLPGLIDKLEKAGLIFVKREWGRPARNYYRVNTARLIEIFNTEAQDTAQAKENYMKKQLEMNRQKEEVEKELQQVDDFLKKEAAALEAAISIKQDEKEAAEREEAAAATAAASAQLQAIGDMLPTGMNQQPAPEPEPAPFVEVPEPARPAAKKREAEQQAELIRYVWREKKFRLMNEYIIETRGWSDLFSAEICSTLEKFIEPELVTIVDIDAGILDYSQAPTKVNAPSRYIGRCIARQVEERYIKMGINITELEIRVQNARFIEKVRSIRPHDPAVLAYDAQLKEEKAALLV